MHRTTIALMGAIVLLAGGLAYSFMSRPEPGLDGVAVRAIVSEMIAGVQVNAPAATEAPMSVSSVDAATLHPMIESYLMSNPRILERLSSALRAEVEAEETEKTRVALASMQAEIYDDPNHVVLGNPNGDVTLVELFDYNCGYCRQAVPDMAKLLDDDPNLRIILKEFPILSQESVDAARVAIAANNAGVDYWAFHEALFTSRGKVTAEAALKVASELGLSPVSVDLDAQGEEITAILQRSFSIAQTLDISGTPSYIIGNEVIPGAVGIAALKQRIANMRECGETVCSG